MSTKKALSLEQLKLLAQRTNSEIEALTTRVDDLVTAGGEPNKVEGVKVNGTALAIAEKMVDILIATGTANGTIKVNGVDVSVAGLAAMAYKANVSQSDLDAALTAVIAGKADSATTLAGYGITDAYTMEQIDAKISSVYKPAGSVTFATLPAASADVLGNVYNVTDAFTTTAAFVEGSGKKHPAGTNVVVVSTGADTYGYDVLAGFVDLTDYAKTDDVVAKVEGKDLSTNDYTNADKAKVDSVAEGATKVEASETDGAIIINGQETTVVEFETDAAVTAMITEVFGAEA